MRETFKETGLQVGATAVIGSRVHPVTGVESTYVAAAMDGEPGVVPGRGRELSDVRWVSLTEAEGLISGMFEAVQQHLHQVIR